MVSPQGYPAKFLVTGQLYYLAVQNSDGTFSYLRLSDPDGQSFELSSDSKVSGRIFLYLPPQSQPYPTETNLTGYVMVNGDRLQQAKILWTGLTDDYQFDLSPGHVLAQACTPKCGTNCTQDNGCGLPCGCGSGKTCLSDGTCVANSSDDPPCSSTGPCGANAGSCSGNCPNGYICTTGGNGKHYCQKSTNWVNIVIGIILALVIVGLLLAIGFISWKIAATNRSGCRIISIPDNNQVNYQTVML
jgi:hypothetical protein